MRMIGTKAMGIRLPIISRGDDLPSIVCEHIVKLSENENIKLSENDVIGITEAIVAKSQNNYGKIEDISIDIKRKFPEGIAGVVFPILSRNRFVNLLKGISNGLNKTYVLLQYPKDEVGNPIMDMEKIDDLEKAYGNTCISLEDFKKIVGDYKHPFTKINYTELYKEVNPNIEIYISRNPNDILKLTKNIIVAEIHNRFTTKKRLLKNGAEKVICMHDILSEKINDSGFNPQYGILGSNISTETEIKLFPKDCEEFVYNVQEKIEKATGIKLNVMIYGDGAFKDPKYGIWELADPVVSPGFTEKLKGEPNEIKLKYVADNDLSKLSGEEKEEAIKNMINQKEKYNTNKEGTTPRNYTDLLGSLCDLISGSGDKGTPIVLVQGYFDNYSTN